jgi:flagellar biosynthetic protein FliR
MQQTLQGLLQGELFGFLMVFVRLGAAFLVMPTIGEGFVSPRVRLALGLIVAAAVAPTVRGVMPTVQADGAALAGLILMETVIGLFIGTLARIMLSALETAGSMIANQLGLASAQVLNPAAGGQTNVLNSVLGISGLLLIMATDLHHMLIRAAVDSYSVFTPGEILPLGDYTDLLTRVVGSSFVIGMQMSAPFVVLGLLFYLGLGLLSRLVPQIQVFFVGLPIQIVLGTALLAFGMSAILMFWLAHFEDQVITLMDFH